MSREPTLPLDVRTLRYVARWHGKQAASAGAIGLRCNEVMHTFAARQWENTARAIERKRPKLTPATPRESKAKPATPGKRKR